MRALLLAAGLAAGSSRLAAQAAVEGRLMGRAMPRAGAVVALVPAEPMPALGADTVVIDQLQLQFVPRIVPIAPGSVVRFRNSDPILHNVFSPGHFNLGTYPRGEMREHTFSQPGVYPILCHVHPEMVAYVAVVPTPYRAAVDQQGRFRFDSVPAGRYRLQVWPGRGAMREETVTVSTAMPPLLIRLDEARP